MGSSCLAQSPTVAYAGISLGEQQLPRRHLEAGPSPATDDEAHDWAAATAGARGGNSRRPSSEVLAPQCLVSPAGLPPLPGTSSSQALATPPPALPRRAATPTAPGKALAVAVRAWPGLSLKCREPGSATESDFGSAEVVPRTPRPGDHGDPRKGRNTSGGQGSSSCSPGSGAAVVSSPRSPRRAEGRLVDSWKTQGTPSPQQSPYVLSSNGITPARGNDFTAMYEAQAQAQVAAAHAAAAQAGGGGSQPRMMPVHATPMTPVGGCRSLFCAPAVIVGGTPTHQAHHFVGPSPTHFIAMPSPGPGSFQPPRLGAHILTPTAVSFYPQSPQHMPQRELPQGLTHGLTPGGPARMQVAVLTGPAVGGGMHSAASALPPPLPVAGGDPCMHAHSPMHGPLDLRPSGPFCMPSW